MSRLIDADALTEKYGDWYVEEGTDEGFIGTLGQLLSEQSETHDKRTGTHGVCLDAISRQAAIDIERNATVDTNPSHFEAHQKFTQFMDDAEISSFGRWQWSNGFNTALTAVGIDLKKLPSAQPDIIYCKDCKWYGRADKRRFYRGMDCLRKRLDTIVPDRDFCSKAERREQE